MSNSALDRGVQLLRGNPRLPPAHIDGLARFLTEAPEEALFRMSPLRYGLEQKLSEKEAIDLFLHATRAGLLDFTWGLLCPGCNGFINTETALRALEETRECTLCLRPVVFDDDSLEVAFTVSPAIRTIRFHDLESLDLRHDASRLLFSSSTSLPVTAFDPALCLGWGRVGPRETFRTEVTLREGFHAVALPLTHSWVHVDAAPSSPVTKVLEMDLLDGRVAPRGFQVAPGKVEVILHNRMPSTALVAIMRAPDEMQHALETARAGGVAPDGSQFRLPYLAGKRLMTSQTFRELFRTESVPGNGGLAVKSLTVLFTDLKGSTALYERIGDLRAYSLVREHFRVLRDLVDVNGGAMVKTIGDAIMATFADIEPAMAAAAQMVERIRAVGKGELELKVGVHNGPCIAVELNEQLDYFGQTVNIASRVQGVAQGGEIAVTEPVFHAPGTQEVVRASRLASTQDRAVLKGVEGEVTIWRLRAA